jgi:DNA-directed RNA polymerase specialized sigma24 family protein
MPWGFRLAHLFRVLGADAASTLGRSAYALFIAAAVRGMPSVDGRDALDLVRDIRGPEDADRLPTEYGRAFGHRVFRVLLARFGSEIAEEAVGDTLLKIAKGKVHIRTGASLVESEGLIVTIALNDGRDLARRQRRRVREVSDVDEEGRTLDIEDPDALAEVERALSPADMQRVLRDLERVHPRARDFVEAVLNGDSQTEIADSWNVSPSYVSKWLREHRGEIGEALRHGLREARTAYSYDRRAAPPG